MLRINETKVNEIQTLLILEGRLIGPWVSLLRESAESLTTSSFALDLSSVSYIDPSGLELLRTWQGRGISLQNCPLYLSELLQQRIANDLLSIPETELVIS